MAYLKTFSHGKRYKKRGTKNYSVVLDIVLAFKGDSVNFNMRLNYSKQLNYSFIKISCICSCTGKTYKNKQSNCLKVSSKVINSWSKLKWLIH